MSKRIEAEGFELVLRNTNGDVIIIPKGKRSLVKQALSQSAHSEIDALAETLPYMKDYADDGDLIPSYKRPTEDLTLRNDNTGVKQPVLLKANGDTKKDLSGTGPLQTKENKAVTDFGNYGEVKKAPIPSYAPSIEDEIVEKTPQEKYIESKVQALEPEIEERLAHKDDPRKEIDLDINPDLNPDFTGAQDNLKTNAPLKNDNLIEDIAGVNKEALEPIDVNTLTSEKDITAAQIRLRDFEGLDLGDYGDRGVDGKLGPKTRQAIKDYNSKLDSVEGWSKAQTAAERLIYNREYRKAETNCSYAGCVKGGTEDMARNAGENTTMFRKKNNIYGDAWTVMDNMYGKDINVSEGYGNMRVGDAVTMTRAVSKNDGKPGSAVPKGVTKEQHFGDITKIVNGVPYVRHWNSHTKRYYEEPVNNINAFNHYELTRVKRPSTLMDIEISEKQYASTFEDNNQSAEIINVMNTEGKAIQKKLHLDKDEYEHLSQLAYGIIGNESGFGESPWAAMRQTIPDRGLKTLKKGADLYRSTKNFVKGDGFQTATPYNEFYNPLSKGYGSMKNSALYGISDNRDIDLKEMQRKAGMLETNDKKTNQVDGLWGTETEAAFNEYNKTHDDKLEYSPLKAQLDDADYTDLSRSANSVNFLLQDLGVDEREFGSSPANSYKGVLTLLATFKKKNPNLTDAELISKFTGNKNPEKYLNSAQKYINYLDTDESNDKQRKLGDKTFGVISDIADNIYTGAADVKDKAIDFMMQHTDALPINLRAIAADVASSANSFTITEEAINDDGLAALKAVIKSNVLRNKTSIEYDDYILDAEGIWHSKEERGDSGEGSYAAVGGKSDLTEMEKVKKALTDPYTMLPQFLGQASIKDLGDGVYEIIDTYDFNDKGTTFGVLDDVKKRGFSPYSIVRSIGRTHGHANQLGNKVKIRIKI